MVTLTVGSVTLDLPDDRATLIAEEVRRAAVAQHAESLGLDAGRELADALELRLVGESDDPVKIEGDQAFALFHYLNVAAPSPSDPLYLAVRALVECD